MGRITLASIILSLFLTAIFVGGRLMQYGIEKVTNDWYFYVGFFVFAFVGLILAMLVATKFGGAGKKKTASTGPMLKKYLINVAIVFVAIGLVGLFQFLATTEGVSAGEAVANIADRAGILAASWVGASLIGGAALLVFHFLGKAQKR